eukprot:6431833-Alexandrium_andersonii.AAC.1
MPVFGAIRLNPQSAMRKAQTCLRRSSLELCGPRNGLKTGPRSSREARSALLLAQIPNLPTKAVPEGVRRREIANSRTPIHNPPIRNPRDPL